MTRIRSEWAFRESISITKIASVAAWRLELFLLRRVVVALLEADGEPVEELLLA